MTRNVINQIQKTVQVSLGFSLVFRLFQVTFRLVRTHEPDSRNLKTIFRKEMVRSTLCDILSVT